MSIETPLSRYRIIREISSGGMATVFLAYDEVLSREVALKVLHPHLLNQPETVQRFTNEAKAIASLSHENIIRIFDYGKSESQPYLVMEYIDGCTLQNVIDKNKTLPDLVTLETARQLVRGLICAHKNGIFHRDIKPANILIDKTGHLHITDFGIAYLVNLQSITMTGTFIGSPSYISPEQAMNKPLQGNTDIFSLGITLYQCITGELPFDSRTPHAIIHAIINNKPEDIRKKKPAVIYRLADLIDACLEKDPRKRLNSVELHERVEMICRDDSLLINSDRIVDFLKSPQEYRDAERELLIQIYRKRTSEEFRRGRVASALRKLEQLKKLEKDIPELNPAPLRNRRTVLIASGLTSIVGLVLFLFSLLSHYGGFFNNKAACRDIALPPAPIPLKPICALLKNFNSIPDTLNTNAKQVSLPYKKITTPGHTESGDSNPVKRQTPAIPDVSAADKGKDTALINSNSAEKDSVMDSNDSLKRGKAGVLNIFTNPPWVTIYIDGIERGRTPMVHSIHISPGIHEILLAKSGFMDYGSSFKMLSSDTMDMRIRLLQQQPRDNN